MRKGKLTTTEAKTLEKCREQEDAAFTKGILFGGFGACLVFMILETVTAPHPPH